MNYIDILLILIIIISAGAGFRSGFIDSGLALLSWIGGLITGFLVYEIPAKMLQKAAPSLGLWAMPLCFILVVIFANLIIDAATSRLVSRIPERVITHKANQLMGIFPGMLNGLIWSTLLAGILTLMPSADEASRQIRKGILAETLSGNINWLHSRLSAIFGRALNSSILTTAPELGSEESVELPFTVKNPEIRPEQEEEMLVLVNNERIQRGLPPVKADRGLTTIARKHSLDMLRRGYFSHYTPEGTDPLSRMKKENIKFLTGAENLALAQNVLIAHEGLMQSREHRDNILNPAFGRLGIGVVDGGIYGLMITQSFGD